MRYGNILFVVFFGRRIAFHWRSLYDVGIVQIVDGHYSLVESPATSRRQIAGGDTPVNMNKVLRQNLPRPDGSVRAGNSPSLSLYLVTPSLPLHLLLNAKQSPCLEAAESPAGVAYLRRKLER